MLFYNNADIDKHRQGKDLGNVVKRGRVVKKKHGIYFIIVLTAIGVGL
ncbi:hypothetical protein LCGC14_1236520 [marine sediment metagenome]|uniref:Uncharacterized protein n=1 Tax=marine sediment metagenome TaxID=412755 RepID=A0A0F9NP74_9ZZZZ